MTQKKGAKTSAGIDWENRKLCSDESCIGVIGTDNRCKECGRAYGSIPEDDASPDGMAETVGSGDDPISAREEDPEDFAPGPDDGWDNRVLCSDGNCIGVIGPDGRCKECGLS